MTRRILFVDDEENILHGLRRSLHKMRGEWEMSFALGGENAIQNLDRMHFDAIISDMRMPGMDGTQLMDQVRKRQPDSLRIILSGETDQLSFARTVGPAHQYLSKPCPSETLINLVQRGIGLRRYIGNDAIRANIGGIETLPMPPSVIFDVLEELVEALLVDEHLLGADLLRAVRHVDVRAVLKQPPDVAPHEGSLRAVELTVDVPEGRQVEDQPDHLLLSGLGVRAER